jgi:YegS/Rv2252/BmrU family lipid kinase
MTWWCLVNPGAGNGRGDPGIEDRVRRALAAHDVGALIHLSESPDHLRSLTVRGIDEGATRFLAVGGDGTVSLVADALLGRRWEEPPILGILPAGSGSDFVRTFGFSQRLEDAVRHLSGTATYPIDVGVLEGAWGRRHFINAADVGLLGATVERAEGLSRSWGRLRYRLAFWLSLPRFSEVPITVRMEHTTYRGMAITIVLANGQYFGTGANVAPRATLVDGLLDVQIFALSKWRVPLLYRKATRGLHLSHPGVHRYRSGRLTIETGDPWPVEIDGDYLGETPVEVWMIPGAIRLKIS